MKTRFLIAFLFIALAITYCARAATEVIKISAFPNTATLNGTDLFLIAVPGVTNRNMTWNQLRDLIGTNGAVYNNLEFITNNYFYSTNAEITYITNNTLYSTNIDVTYITNINLFSSNAYITNIVVNNGYITNLYVSNSYITNLDVQYITNNTTYTTNLFVTAVTTNFFLYSTNIYNQDVIVSNYFTTNVFNDTYMSNFFVTNQIFYETNYYVEYISTTNFLSFITNNYVSNFFNTNIFVENTYVSNYFTTNYNPLIQYISNYTFNVAWPLTNATLYGTTTISPVTGTLAGRIILSSSGVDTISLQASNASIAAGVFWFKTNSWSGPTNSLPMNLQDQYYTTATDISVTSLSSLPPSGYGSGITLSLTNSSAANIVFRFPSSIIIPERTNAVVLSNASGGILSIKYSPVRGTNAIWKQF